MRIHIDSLTGLVLAGLGESPSPTSAFAGEEEGLSLRRLAIEVAPEAASLAIMEAELEELDDFSHFGDSVGWLGGGAGYVMLPPDFLRLVSFRMSDWSVSVTSAVAPDSPLFRLQSLPCRGVRGQPSRPVCRLLQRGVGRVLEFYSCRSQEATVKEGLYIARPFLDAEGYLRLPAACLPATIEKMTSMMAETLSS